MPDTPARRLDVRLGALLGALLVFLAVYAYGRAASEYIAHPDRHTQYRVAAILCLAVGGSGVAIVVAAVARWMRSARAAARTGAT